MKHKEWLRERGGTCSLPEVVGGIEAMRAVMQHEAHRLDALLLCVTEALAELVSDFAHKRQPAPRISRSPLPSAEGTTQTVLSERQVQDLALTVVCVPNLLGCSARRTASACSSSVSRGPSSSWYTPLLGNPDSWFGRRGSGEIAHLTSAGGAVQIV